MKLNQTLVRHSFRAVTMPKRKSFPKAIADLHFYHLENIKRENSLTIWLSLLFALIELWNYCVHSLSWKCQELFCYVYAIQFSLIITHRAEGRWKGDGRGKYIYRESTFKNQQKCQVDFLIFILMAISNFPSFLFATLPMKVSFRFLPSLAADVIK